MAQFESSFYGTISVDSIDITVYYTEVSNTAPTIGTGPSDGGSSTTTPTSAGSNVTFTATASDTESDNYYLAICKTDAITAVNNGAPTCATDQTWCVSGSTASGSAATCNSATSLATARSNGWYAFVCDHNAASACSTPGAQASGDNGSPFVVNNYFAKSGGGDWSSANTWSATGSAGSDNAGVPAATDNVIFDSGANTAVVVDTTGAVAKTVTFQNSANSITFTATKILTVSGNYTQVSGMTVTGTGTLVINAAATLTSGGVTFPGALTFATGVGTEVLSGNWVNTGLVTISATTVLNKTSAETLTANGGLTISGNTSGTAGIIIGGGSWTASAWMYLSNNLTFAGNSTVSGTVYLLSGTLTYSSGTITTTNSTLSLKGTCTLNTNGITWNKINSENNGGTTTLTSNLTATGLVYIKSSLTLNKTVAETATFSGGLTTTQDISGTADVILTGGTWSSGAGDGASYGSLTFAGNVTISGSVYKRAGTLTYVSGTITTTNSTLVIYTPTTFNTNGMIWNNISFPLNTGTSTLTSNLTANGLVGISVATVINKTAAETFTINGGLTVNAALSGTAGIILGGGTWSGSSTSGVANNLTFAGNSTVSGTVYYKTGALTYSSGTITTTSSTLDLRGAATLNTNGVNWNNITFTTAGTYTLTSNLTANGLTTITGATVLNKTSAETLTTNGGLTMGANLSGTAGIILGGGTWSGNFILYNDLTFNGSSTLSGYVDWAGSIMTYVTGTITTTGSHLSIRGASSPKTLNTNGITWNDVSIVTSDEILTLTSNFTTNGLFRLYNSAAINKTASETATFNGGITVDAALSGTATIVLGGGTWSGASTISNAISTSGTITLGASQVASGLVTVGSATVLNYTTNQTLTCNGGLTVSGGILSGTATVILGGGTWISSEYYTNSNITLAGNVTLSGTVNVASAGSPTITYSSGTITTTGSTLRNGGSVTYNTNGIIWDSVIVADGPITLTSNFRADGLATVWTAAINKTASETATFNGGLTVNAALSGTATVILGGGTWSGSSVISNALNITGAVTLSGAITYGGTALNLTGSTLTNSSSTLTLTTTMTLTSGGVTFPGALTFSGLSVTATLADNWVVTGLVYNKDYALALDGNQITCNGGLYQTAAISGTTTIILGGGTWSKLYTTTISNNLTFAGDVTISGEVVYSSGILTYSSGTITTTSSTLTLKSGATLNTNGITWNNVTFSTAGTYTLSSNLTANGLVGVTGLTVLNKTSAETLTANGGLAMGASINLSGTADIVLGGGTWSGNGTISNNLTINATTLTVSGSVRYKTGTLTYTAGTVTTTSSTLFLDGAATLDTDRGATKVTWNTISNGLNGYTITLASNLTASSLVLYAGTASVFNGAYNFTLTNGITAGCSTSGTTTIVLSGGTWSGAGYITNNLTLAGNVTVSGTVYYKTGALTYSSGTITTTSSTLDLRGAATLNTNGVTWNNVTFTTAGTYTLSSNLTASGLVTITGETVLNKTSAETATFNGGLTVNAALSGTAGIVLGGGTWSGASAISNTISTSGTITLGASVTASGLVTVGSATVLNYTTNETLTVNGGITTNARLSGTAGLIIGGGTWSSSDGSWVDNNITFNGDSTISGKVYFGYTANPIMTYTSGTITTTGSTLNIDNPVTLNTNGITWNNMTSLGYAKTLTSNLTVNGLFTATDSHGATSLNLASAETATLNGGLTVNGNNGPLAGTATIILGGGTWSGSNTYGVSANLTFAGNVTVSGTVYYQTGALTYSSGTITTTSSTLDLRGAATLNTNGVTWNNVTFTTAGTYTLSSNLTANGLTTITGATVLNKTASETLTCNGGLTVNAALSGTATVILGGGTWSAGSSAGTVANNLTFAGNSTVSGTVYYKTGTLTYSSGTITTTSSTLDLRGAATLNTNGITWNNVTFSTAGTYTLTSNLTANGLVTVGANTALNKTTSETLTANGGISVVAHLYVEGATPATIILGGGTWSSSGESRIDNPLTFNGNCTVSGDVYYSTGTLTYTSGTITTTGSTLHLKSYLTGSTTLDTSGITWNNVNAFSTSTVTLSSDLNVGGNFSVAATKTLTISGTQNINVAGNWTNSGTYTKGTETVVFTTGTHIVTGANGFNNLTLNPSNAITFPASTTQTIDGTLSCTGTAGNVITLTSSTPGTPATLSKASGTVSCDYLSLTDSTATGGATWLPGIHTTNVSGNSGWVFNVASASPTSATQLKHNASTSISNADYTNETDVNLRASATDADTTEVINLFFEVATNSASFASPATPTTGTSCISGTEDASCASNIWYVTSGSGDYSSTPFTGTTNVAGLSNATGYKWQVKACDDDSACSAWVDYNASQPNFTVDTTAPSSVSSDADGAWHDATFDVTLNCTDAASGCDKVYYCINVYGDPTCTPDTNFVSPGATFNFSSQGEYVLRLKGVDLVGNATVAADETNHLKLDTVFPTITITNPNTNSEASKTITALTDEGTLTMSNTTGLICDGTLTFVDYASQTFTDITDNGKKVCYKAVDLAGNTTYTMSNAIAGIANQGSSPIPPPGQAVRASFAVSINNGTDSTTIRNVILNLTASSNFVRMAISNSPNFANAVQQTYTATKLWTIEDGQGQKTVYVKFFTNYGVASDIISDTINYNPPVGEPGQIIYPPITEAVPQEPQIVFQGGNIISQKQFEKIDILPLPEAIKELAFKFPKFASTLEKVGISKPEDVEKLKVAQLTFPSLSEVAEVSPNVAFSEFTDEQKQKIPSNITFAKTGADNIDLNIKVSVSDLNKPTQSIATIQNKPLYLTVKPDNPASAVKGYVIFKSANSQSVFLDWTKKLSADLSASLLDATNFIKNTDPLSNSPEVTAQKDLVLAEFDYVDMGNVWTAQINAPAVDGKYEIRTVVKYKDITADKKSSETLSMILVVDPEGYVYRKDGNDQTRIKDATVSIYWLNPEAKQYELWPAKDFQQENPQTTDITGKYSFLVPEGTYYLEVKSQDYVTYQGQPFQVVDGSGVHLNIELKTKNWFLRLFTIERIMLGLVIILLIAIFANMILKKRNN